MRPDVATKAYGEEPSIAVRHLDETGKEGYTIDLRAGIAVAGLVEAPELLGKVPTQEVWILAKEELERLEIIIKDMGMATTGGLACEPEAVELADRRPRPIG